MPEHELQERRVGEPGVTPAAPTTAPPAVAGFGLPVAGGLRVGAVDDPAETEAESIARDVVAALRGAPVQPSGVRGSPAGTTGVQALARRTAQPTIGAEGGPLGVDALAELRAARGGGTELPAGVREAFEPLMGDLGHVRVHTGDAARSLATGMHATAFTVGPDVFFRDGFPDTSSADGQRVLAHELTHTLQQAGGHAAPAQRASSDAIAPPAIDRLARRSRGPVVQRLAVTDAPSGWGAQPVKRSGEGIAGVFFVGPSGADVVVKPLASTGNVEYANTFMESMGLTAPGTQRYPKTGTEGNAISTLLLANQDKGRTPTEVKDQVDTANAYLVMEKVEGKSIQSLSDAEAVEFLQNADALKATGRIMVADAFLGNEDRLVGAKANLGNFFYQAATTIAPGVVRTIDNDSRFNPAQVKTKRSGAKEVEGQLGTKMFYINQLSTPAGRDHFISQFLTRFKGAHKNNANALAEATGQEVAIKASIDQGIQEAFDEIRQLFETNIELVASVSKGYDVESEGTRDRTAAKAAAKYTSAVAGGMDPDTAATKLVSYLEYRERRDKTPPGLKWVTKLVSKTGF